MNEGILLYITFISVVLIFGATVWAYFYVSNSSKEKKLVENRRWIEQLPSLVSTLGVLGTFAGITLGLVNFNSEDLQNSIPLLLNGLKTAFFTSLAGMIGSLILSRKVSAVYDEEDKGVSDINVAAVEIVKAVKEMSDTTKNTIQSLANSFSQQSNNQTAFYNTALTEMQSASASLKDSASTLSSLLLQAQSQTTSQSELENISSGMLLALDNIESNGEEQKRHNAQLTSCQTAFYNTALTEMQSASASLKDSASTLSSLLLQAQSQTTSLSELGNTSSSMLMSVGNIESNGEEQKKHNAQLTNYIGEIVDATSAMVSTDESIAENVKALGTKLHDEVVEIEDKMNETNVLLTKKFDEFTELLKKSNTEALVEVMKKVTEEFQKQMNALINKLIQENFDQLNKSVEKLNQWQIENKEMISSLTSQYKQMAVEFEGTSTTLEAVGKDTKSLVSDGGKLNQLLDSLSKVMIEDEKFVEITKNLENVIELTKSNMGQFDESTRTLNEWVRKQRNFVDGVTLLINKLDEISKLKDYNGQFWQGTKRSLEEGVGIITEGSKSLNAQLKNLDAQFYARLSATLAELDTCIQALIKKK